MPGCWGANQKPFEFSVCDFSGVSPFRLSPCLILCHVLGCSGSISLHQYCPPPWCLTIPTALLELPRKYPSLRTEARYRLGQSSSPEIVLELWLFAILWWMISQPLFSFPLQTSLVLKYKASFSRIILLLLSQNPHLFSGLCSTVLFFLSDLIMSFNSSPSPSLMRWAFCSFTSGN